MLPILPEFTTLTKLCVWVLKSFSQTSGQNKIDQSGEAIVTHSNFNNVVSSSKLSREEEKNSKSRKDVLHKLNHDGFTIDILLDFLLCANCELS